MTRHREGHAGGGAGFDRQGDALVRDESGDRQRPLALQGLFRQVVVASVHRRVDDHGIAAVALVDPVPNGGRVGGEVVAVFAVRRSHSRSAAKATDFPGIARLVRSSMSGTQAYRNGVWQ